MRPMNIPSRAPPPPFVPISNLELEGFPGTAPSCEQCGPKSRGHALVRITEFDGAVATIIICEGCLRVHLTCVAAFLGIPIRWRTEL